MKQVTMLVTAATLAIINILALPSLAKEQEIGTEQKDHDSRLFLRMSTIILKPGQKSIGIATSYSNSMQGQAPLEKTTRQISVATTLRLALSERMEVSATIPLAWRQFEKDNYVDETREKRDGSGLGDISLGAKFLLFNEEVSSPEIVASLGVGIPTNDNNYGDDVAIGTGHYSVSLGLSALKSIDPATFFGSLSYTHYFDRKFGERDVKRGGSVDYNLGVGYALNHRLTLSSRVHGSFSGKLEIDSEVAQFSDKEPVLLENNITFAWDRETTIDPSITLGLNDDAPDTTFGLSISRRF